ncbi:MAG TPA: trypsin-like peptidase domain-containing protein, partial [Acidimicrobiia bacterium]
PTPPPDRPPGPKSPWEPVDPEAQSPWAPAPPPAPEPPPPAAENPPAATPPPPPDPAESSSEAWDNPLASPEAWVNPLAESEESRAAPPPPSTPPPAWQVGSPAAPAWGETALPVAAKPAAPRRPIMLAAAVGAVVGALVAGLLVTAVKDDETAAPARTPSFSNNTSKIARAGDIQEILSRVEPAVVSIRTRSLSLGDFLRPVPGEGAGTGFVIAPDGVLVTNNHVVSGAQTIEVVFADDRKMPARVLGRDPTTDLAVLKVDATDLPVAALGDSSALKVGDDVIAIGNALGLEGGPTVTRGIVSAEDRTITAESGIRLEHVIQTDTAINPGNSGGPLVNSAGEVVGINTAVAGDAQNIGFSIAINAAKPIIEELRQGTTKSRPFLGVKMITFTPEYAEGLGVTVNSGAVVADVTAGSGAEVAGLRTGDVITSIDGKEVKAAEDVTSAVNAHKPGEDIKLTFVRRDQTQEITVKLGERPVDAG